MTPIKFGPQSFSLIAVAVVVIVVLLRNQRARTLRIERLWIRPVIFLAILASTLVAAPPPLDPLSLAVMGGALAAGCLLGWHRGRLMRIQVDPQTHALTSQASPAGMIFIVAIVLIRMGLRGALAQGSVIGISAAAGADAFIALGAGVMATQGAEMWLRARGLLAQAVAAKAAGDSPIVS